MASKKINGDGDRLSNLSDSLLLHHVLSFMDTKYAVRTSVLSSRWRDLWKSLPHLTFDKLITPYNRRFVDLVNGVLIVRDGSDIQSFRLSGIHDSDFPNLHNWILGAIGRRVRKIDIRVCTTASTPLKFPYGMFNCQTLSTLYLSGDKLGNIYHYLRVHLPSNISLPNLKVLQLYRVVFRDCDVASKLISGCPSLQTLKIIHCTFDVGGWLVINLPKLASLTIRVQDWNHLFDFPHCNIRLCAPNLKYLLCDADFRCGYSVMEGFAHLECAIISLEIFKGIRTDPEDWLGYGGRKEFEKKKIRYVRNILEAVHHTKVLTLNPCMLQLAFESRVAQQGLSLQFPNLKHLKLQTRFSRDCALSIMQFLKTSQMETLKIEIVENLFSWDPLILNQNSLSSSRIGGWWDLELSNQCVFNHLKDVKISGIVGCLTEVKFVEVILKKATILRRMVICSSVKSPIGKKGLIDLSQILMDTPRASSNVALVLV